VAQLVQCLLYKCEPELKSQSHQKKKKKRKKERKKKKDFRALESTVKQASKVDRQRPKGPGPSRDPWPHQPEL
jgi:hypothetical protein